MTTDSSLNTGIIVLCTTVQRMTTIKAMENVLGIALWESERRHILIQTAPPGRRNCLVSRGDATQDGPGITAFVIFSLKPEREEYSNQWHSSHAHMQI